MAATFPDRHIGPRGTDRDEMLALLGRSTIDELIDAAVPESIRSGEPLDLPSPVSEPEVVDELRRLADQNRVVTSLIGLGYHDTHTPAVIQRNVLENPAWYTAYTPYQPEISQGRLEALLNFQTLVSDLTGMDLANASLLDEGTAAAEAMTMMDRLVKGDTTRVFVDSDCHPQTIAVIEARAEPLGIDVVVGDAWSDDLRPDEVYGVIVQYPGSSGEVRDLEPVVDAVHAAGGLVTVATDLLACTVLTPPGEKGADIVVGNSQRFGVPLGYGGPHAAFISCRDEHKRSLPGRLVGVSVDAAGRPALRLALQTREQHIRREKATSNICTAQVLLAVMASMYAVYHGPEGLRSIARRVAGYTTTLASKLEQRGYTIVNERSFDTLTIGVPPGEAETIHSRAAEHSLNLRRLDGDRVGVSLDETTDHDVLARVLACFPPASGSTEDDGRWMAYGNPRVPDELRRTSEFLTHPVFHEHRSETEMLRYLRSLADKDIALDRAMIPLGSCTMKLNATTEMVAITWPEFGRIHPFAPAEQTAGYKAMIDELAAMLVEITGYAAVSLQPNAGSQGELAGLLAIRGWHESRGEGERDVCLIPSSAHGTNAASAVMAGMNVVVVACDDGGNVDVDDLKAKVIEHADDLAALMVTYPSTHGVFEQQITEICDLVHQYGGQVYLDGANLNALVGVARPGRFGADVSHLNLHKTFCIPHGGGGPGVGPVAVGEHLAPYLPNHPLDGGAGPAGGPGPISAAPYGSASILPISWAYCRLMGAEGLTRATEVAILSANYIASRLADAYPVLYTGETGLVAHECVLDIRAMTRETGVTVDDIAKRLIDYGFHAPTMSFPVAGTLMVEPTESESRAELDRFCEAMLAIRAEIAAIERGEVEHDDSPLAHAPHTAVDLLAEDWNRPYSRHEAAYPGTRPADQKYWPPVSRIDGGYGDRNLVCSCPPVEDYTT